VSERRSVILLLLLFLEEEENEERGSIDVVVVLVLSVDGKEDEVVIWREDRTSWWVMGFRASWWCWQLDKAILLLEREKHCLKSLRRLLLRADNIMT